MKKAFKIVSTVMLILALTAFCVSVALPGMIGGAKESEFFAMIILTGSMVVFALVGAFLTTAKNGIAVRVGHGMLITGFVLGLADSVVAIDYSTSAVIMTVSFGLLALHYIFKLVVIILNKGSEMITNPEEDIRIVRIKAWKQLMEEGIITEEEYEEKRLAILDIKPKKDKPE